MRAADIMTREVQTAPPDESVAAAARTFRERGISSVVVVEAGAPVGIVTERDVVNLVADGLDPATTPLADRMTRDLVTVTAKTDLADAAALMGEHRIRHLPVMDRGKLAGIISIRDLTLWAVDEMTGEHELADLQGGSAALSAVGRVKGPRG